MKIMFTNRSNLEAGSAIDMALDAGALFEVKTEPVTVAGTIPTISGGVYRGQPENVVHYRETENGPLVLNIAHPSHPSSNYLQVVETAEALFPESTVNLRVIDGGKKLMFTQDLGQEFDLGDGDVIRPNLLWRASLDSSWSTGAFGHAHRWFCTNQMPFANTTVRVRRSVNHDLSLARRSAIIAQVLGQFETFVDGVSTLKRIQVTERQFRAILDKLVPAPAEDAHGKTVNTYEKKVAAIRYYFREEQDGPAAGTAWAAYNAFQSAELHDFTEGAHQARKQAEIVADGRWQDLSVAAEKELLALV